MMNALRKKAREQEMIHLLYLTVCPRDYPGFPFCHRGWMYYTPHRVHRSRFSHFFHPSGSGSPGRSHPWLLQVRKILGSASF